MDREMLWMKSLSSQHMFLVTNESEEAYAREIGYILCDQDGNVVPEPRREIRLRRALRYAAEHEFATLRWPGRPYDRPIVRAGESAWNALAWATNRILAIVDSAITAEEKSEGRSPLIATHEAVTRSEVFRSGTDTDGAPPPGGTGSR